MANFDTAFNITLGHEGGFSNLKTDRGGMTFRGISRRAHPDWEGWHLIDTLGLSPSELLENETMQGLVRSLYHAEYWLDFPSQEIANEVFDTSVNMGTSTARKFLQRVVNMFNKQGSITPDLKVDGAVGPATRRGLDELLRARDVKVFVKALNVVQGGKFVRIAENDKTQEDYIYGWIKNRC